MTGILYRLTWAGLQVTGAWLFRVYTSGTENVPAHGGVVIASNHQSFVDPAILGAAMPRPINFMARDNLFRVPILGALITAYAAIPVRRGTADREALRQVAEVARGGGVVCVFPEGTRSTDGSMSPLKRGVLLLASLAQVPVVPVGVWGAHRVWPRGRRLPRPGPIRVRIGPAIPYQSVLAEGGLALLSRSIADLVGVPAPPLAARAAADPTGPAPGASGPDGPSSLAPAGF